MKKTRIITQFTRSASPLRGVGRKTADGVAVRLQIMHPAAPTNGHRSSKYLPASPVSVWTLLPLPGHSALPPSVLLPPYQPGVRSCRQWDPLELAGAKWEGETVTDAGPGQASRNWHRNWLQGTCHLTRMGKLPGQLQPWVPPPGLQTQAPSGITHGTLLLHQPPAGAWDSLNLHRTADPAGLLLPHCKGDTRHLEP